MAEKQYIKLNVDDDGVAVLTIDHPPVNALSTKVLAELSDTLDEIKDDPKVKVVVIAGAGSFAFIAGADINEIMQISDKETGYKLAREGQKIITKLEKLGKPTIAAIHSHCLGGGLELAMACHMRIAGDRAKLGQPEINLGIMPGFGGSQRLPRIVGKAKAIEMILTGDNISAQEAYRIGLVNKVVPQSDVLKVAKDLARRIARKGQIAVRHSLKAILEGYEMPLDEALDFEAKLFGELCETEDMKEGLRAFKEKRQPQFKDR